MNFRVKRLTLNFPVLQKIDKTESRGCFRTEGGADDLAKLHSRWSRLQKDFVNLLLLIDPLSWKENDITQRKQILKRNNFESTFKLKISNID